MQRITTIALLSLGLSACDLPPNNSTQWGYRGTGMVQVEDPGTKAEIVADNALPEPIPEIPLIGETAGDSYENVQVLGHLDVAEFTRLMTAITEWVSPEQGCTYCHNAENFADDSMYTKVVARRMFQMTHEINRNWNKHVGEVGVTCYTCHRGMNVPANIWFDPGPSEAAPNAGWRNGQNGAGNTEVAYSSLPYDPFTPYLLNDMEIRVQADAALPMGGGASIGSTEGTYGLMMHFSDSLGVNCTFCHNTRAFSDWSQSPPQRVRAWHAIRMLRTLNNDYLDPLQPVYPDHRLGPVGDAPKGNCTTCHQGLNKPLNGASMLAQYPELVK